MRITSDQAFDMLPHVAAISEKLGMVEYVKKVRKENKGLTENQAAEKAIYFIMKNIPKVKKEVFEIAGIAFQIPAEEAKTIAVFKLVKELIEMTRDKELVDFFKSAVD